MTACEFRSPTSLADWDAYHTIRRQVLFERRGRLDEYDPNHPDEHRAGHYPKILVDQGHIIAVIRIDIAPPRATFRRVAVREEYQGRGYGRQLIRLAEIFAAEHSCREVLSMVDQAAVGFYRKCGFTGGGEPRTPESPIRMVKRIEGIKTPAVAQ